jgi:hypothetical protein
MSDYRLDDQVQSLAKAKDLLYVQTSSEAHPASYPMHISTPFPRGNAQLGHDADHSSHLVPTSIMGRSHTSSPLLNLHGIAGQLYFFTLIYCPTRTHIESVLK